MAQPRSKVRVKDKGFEAFFKRAKRGAAFKVKVGVQGDEALEPHNPGGPSNVLVASVHEFGAPSVNVPERSFFRSTSDEKERAWQRELAAAGRRVAKGASPQGELLLVGEVARDDIIDKIHSGIPPALKPATVRKKRGETTPLIDTGQLINSLSTVVSKK